MSHKKIVTCSGAARFEYRCTVQQVTEKLMVMKNYKNKSVELKKHVSTIHCANALSLLQRKIANALLFHAYEDLLLQEEYQISVRELCELIGYDSHDYKSIKKALVDLLSTVIQWNIIEEGLPESEGEWNASSIISDASIKGSVCTYSYSNRMKQLLYMPAIYGRLNMKLMSQFKSTYGLALYENVVRYQNLSQTPWFDLEVFRKLMGVADDKYAVFRDFKRRVLDKAVLEVNAIANISIEVEFQRQKRAVVALKFLIIKKSDTQSDKSVVAKNSLYKHLGEEYGLNAKQIHTITNRYDESYVFEKISLIESSNSFQSGKIINLGKYLMHALEDDYQKPQASTNKKAVEKQQKDLTQQQQKQKEHYMDTLKKAYSAYTDDHLNAQLDSLTREQRKQVKSAFEDHIATMDILNKRYQKEGLDNKIIFMEFKNFIKQAFPELLQTALSFENFEKNLNSESESL